VERNRKAGQNPPRVVASIEEEEEEEEEEVALTTFCFSYYRGNTTGCSVARF
jgi:hypothetical protein